MYTIRMDIPAEIKTLPPRQIEVTKGRPRVQKDLQRECVQWYKEQGWEYVYSLMYGEIKRHKDGSICPDVNGNPLRHPVDRKIAWEVAKTLLAYGFGKPPEKIEVDINTGEARQEEVKPATLTRDQIIAFLKQTEDKDSVEIPEVAPRPPAQIPHIVMDAEVVFNDVPQAPPSAPSAPTVDLFSWQP